MEPISCYARRGGIGVEASVRVSRGQLRVSVAGSQTWVWPLAEVDLIDKGSRIELLLGGRKVEIVPSEPSRFRREVGAAIAAARCLAIGQECDPEGTAGLCDQGHLWHDVRLPDNVPRRVCSQCGQLMIDLSASDRASVG